MKAIVYVVGDNHYTFFVAANCNKTLAEFSEHEKHHDLTKDQLKEVHGLIKAEAKKSGLIKKQDEKPVE